MRHQNVPRPCLHVLFSEPNPNILLHQRKLVSPLSCYFQRINFNLCSVRSRAFESGNIFILFALKTELAQIRWQGFKASITFLSVDAVHSRVA